jgi:hypothetical protein
MAIIAGFYWFWIPICAAATCAGGGLLLGICTGASHARLPERYMKSSLIGLNEPRPPRCRHRSLYRFTFSLVYGLRIFVILSRNTRLAETHLYALQSSADSGPLRIEDHDVESGGLVVTSIRFFVAMQN